jgi:glutamate/tyrosine decarboxylase-like PLP-dependent enzyme
MGPEATDVRDPDDELLFDYARARALAFLGSVSERPVRAAATYADLLRRLPGSLPDQPTPAIRILEDLARDLDPGLVANAGPRYFGFVTGGAYPAAVAADWLVSAWDQNTTLHVMSPAMSALESCTARWILEALGLPIDASVGFVTGAHMSNVTALAAARHEMLRRANWDVEARGLQGAPPLIVVASDEAHSSIQAAARLIGIGGDTIVRVAADEQGRMRPDALERALPTVNGPVIVCAQAGNVNTGACDPLGAIAALTHARSGWLHVDGAFGL